MTRRQFNVLGDRLIAHSSPAEADLAELRTALAAYQEVLERVKVHLRDLGFAPTPRVKTTPTMTDKLRRTPGMDLSRMQDIAGARITVRDLAAQDRAKNRISEFYTGQGCRWRAIDRREDPRFGYRAMHLVVHVDDLPVEIQIRTELQDSWAQIVERLGDRWGRGIRYGQDPQDPESIVRSGGTVMTRRELLALLMRLSDLIWAVEQNRRGLDTNNQGLADTDSGWRDLKPTASPELRVSEVAPELAGLPEALAAVLTDRSEQLDTEARELLATPFDDLTVAQLSRMHEIAMGLLRGAVTAMTDTLVATEQRARDILQLIAGAADEGA